MYVGLYVCFLGFLRTGEVVVPSETAYDAAVHLSVGCVRVDSRAKPTYLEVVIKSSKKRWHSQERDSGAGSDRQEGMPRSNYLKLHGQPETSWVLCLWAILRIQSWQSVAGKYLLWN